jgi:hypothetical protein
LKRTKILSKKQLTLGTGEQTMELKRDEIISEIDTKIKYAKFINTDAVILSSKAAQFCLEHAQFYEQKIEELTEENEAISERYAIQVVTAIELDKQVQRLTEENERLRACVMSEEQVRVIAKATIEDGISIIRADTVRKYREQLHRAFAHSDSKDKFNKGVFLEMVDLIAKEMEEGEK